MPADPATLLALAARAEAGDTDHPFDAKVFIATAESPFSLYHDCILAVMGGFRARVEFDDIPHYRTPEELMALAAKLRAMAGSATDAE